LNSLETVVVQGSESNVSVSGITRRPKFSPDSRWLAFAKDNEIRKVAVAGGPPVTLVQAPGLTNFVWADDGALIYQAEQNLWRAGETGGSAEPIAQGLTGRVQSFDVLPVVTFCSAAFPQEPSPQHDPRSSSDRSQMVARRLSSRVVSKRTTSPRDTSSITRTGTC
jgi:hypothetical protein